MTEHTHPNDARKEIPVLLRTIARYAVQGFGIPTFGELIDVAPGEPINLTIAAIGDKGDEAIEDLKHDTIDFAATGTVHDVQDALRRLDDLYLAQRTNHCEAYYLIGIIVTLRAMAMARGLMSLEIENVITELVNRDDLAEGDNWTAPKKGGGK